LGDGEHLGLGELPWLQRRPVLARQRAGADRAPRRAGAENVHCRLRLQSLIGGPEVHVRCGRRRLELVFLFRLLGARSKASDGQSAGEQQNDRTAAEVSSHHNQTLPVETCMEGEKFPKKLFRYYMELALT